MAKAIIPTFRPATLRLLKISYDCDLTHQHSDVVPLGVLADLSADDIYGLGLIARKALSPDEEKKIGQLVRADLAAPFTYLLNNIYNLVFKSDEPLKSFEQLLDRHTHSLRFEPLQNVPIKLPAPLQAATSEARWLWLKDELSKYGNEAYWGMFSDDLPEVIDKLVAEQTRELKAAA
jgi:hypothetical protein